MKIGILIPTYKRKDFLEQSLRSVLEQTYPELEIIVIDNGSSDEIGKIVMRLTDPRIRYIQNEKNIGLIGSIRKGMQLFSDRVSWCTILPDDDLLDREFIGTMVDYVSSRREIDVVHGHRILIDAEGHVLSEASRPPEQESAAAYLFNRARFVRQTFLAGVFFSRSAYERVGGYPQFTTGMASDDALIFALSVQRGLYFNGKAVCSIRMHAEAESLGHADLYRHFQAFDDFRRYVNEKAEMAGKYTAKELRLIRRTLLQYMRLTISELWMRRVHHVLIREEITLSPELDQLYNTAVGHDYVFTVRVRLSGFLGNSLGYCPENNIIYRAMWDSLFKLYRYWLRIVPTRLA
jgi:glycosyltransferase involved in cell wall biosynthesis